MCSAVMKDLDLLILRNRVSSLENVPIWAVPPCYVFDLIIIWIRIFRIRNVQICVVLAWKLVVLLIFTNSVFKVQNISYMDIVDVQVFQFGNC